MVPRLKDILDILEEMAPSRTAEDWDNPGLQVGDSSKEVKKIFVSVDPTLEAVMEASRRKAQLLLTHHPLIFRSLSQLNQEIYPGNVIYEAFKRGVSVATAHTNLDVMPGGINDLLANLFDLQDVEVLQRGDKNNAEDNTGLGRIGNLQKPMRLSTMVGAVKAVLRTQNVKVVGSKTSIIRRVAVVGGSGGGMIARAASMGADLLITGDVTHHEALAAEELGMALIDGGHFHTEKAALMLFADQFRQRLRQLGWDVLVERFDEERDPMRYE